MKLYGIYQCLPLPAKTGSYIVFRFVMLVAVVYDDVICVLAARFPEPVCSWICCQFLAVACPDDDV